MASCERLSDIGCKEYLTIMNGFRAQSIVFSVIRGGTWFVYWRATIVPMWAEPFQNDLLAVHRPFETYILLTQTLLAGCSRCSGT